MGEDFGRWKWKLAILLALLSSNKKAEEHATNTAQKRATGAGRWEMTSFKVKSTESISTYRHER